MRCSDDTHRPNCGSHGLHQGHAAVKARREGEGVQGWFHFPTRSEPAFFACRSLGLIWAAKQGRSASSDCHFVSLSISAHAAFMGILPASRKLLPRVQHALWGEVFSASLPAGLVPVRCRHRGAGWPNLRGPDNSIRWFACI